MSRFEERKTEYFIERVHKVTNEERLMHYDTYDDTWRTATEFKHVVGSDDFEYLKSTINGFKQMDAIKLQFGMISEIEFDYNIIQKDDNSFRIDENKDPIVEPEEPTEPEPAPEPEPEPAPEPTEEPTGPEPTDPEPV